MNCAPYLVFINVLTMLLSVALMGAGAYAHAKQLTVSYLSDGLIILGVIVFLLSIVAIVGSTSESGSSKQKVLLNIYMLVDFLSIFAIIFLAVGCLVFTEALRTYITDQYNSASNAAWVAQINSLTGCSANKAQEISCLTTFVIQHAKILGGIGLTIAFVMITGLVAVIQVLGFDSILKLIVRLLAVCFLLIGIALAAIGFQTYKTAGAYNAAVIGLAVVGCVIFFTAILGLWGSRDSAGESTWPLTIYASLLTILSLIVLVMGCFLYGFDWATWLNTGSNFTNAFNKLPSSIQSYLADKCPTSTYTTAAAVQTCQIGVLTSLFTQYSKAIGLFGVIVFFWLLLGATATWVLRRHHLNQFQGDLGTPLPVSSVPGANVPKRAVY